MPWCTQRCFHEPPAWGVGTLAGHSWLAHQPSPECPSSVSDPSPKATTLLPPHWARNLSILPSAEARGSSPWVHDQGTGRPVGVSAEFLGEQGQSPQPRKKPQRVRSRERAEQGPKPSRTKPATPGDGRWTQVGRERVGLGSCWGSYWPGRAHLSSHLPLGTLLPRALKPSRSPALHRLLGPASSCSPLSPGLNGPVHWEA